MSQSPLCKLSIHLLAKAFTKIEVDQSIPFAIISSTDTLKTIRNFIKCFNINNSRDNFPGNLWGVPFVDLDKIKNNSIVIACKRIGNSNIHDFSNALNCIVYFDPDREIKCLDYLTEENVWGLKVNLS